MLEFAKKIALTAGKKHAEKFRHSHLKVNFKEKFNPVISQDTKTEEYLKKQIQKKYPNHGILGEEGTDKKSRNSFTWVIDPLDGTVNFIRGFAYFTVSIAVLKNNKPYLGVVYNPISREMFYAQQNKGAFLNKKRIHVSKVKRLSDSYLSTGFRYNRGKGFTRPLKKIKIALEKTLVVRRTGSASMDLCNVARGTFDGFFMYDTKKWDVMAGLLIIKEAGGKFDLKEKTKNDLNVLTTNGKIQSQLKKVLKWR
tara:strand:- start:3318 stop:4076 length:759 start_codon:yes stop_codon:yes gene_type:complete